MAPLRMSISLRYGVEEAKPQATGVVGWGDTYTSGPEKPNLAFGMISGPISAPYSLKAIMLIDGSALTRKGATPPSDT